MDTRSKFAFSLSLSALALAGWQGWVSGMPGHGTAVAGCSADGGCGALAATRWASLFGLSVAWAGAAVYGTMAVLLAVRPLSFRFTGVLAWSVAGAALWFVSLQAVLGKFCVLCCTTHTMGILAASLVLCPRQAAAGFWRGMGRGALPGLSLTAFLALVQTFQPAPASARVGLLADSMAGKAAATAAAHPGQGASNTAAPAADAAEQVSAFYFPVKDAPGQLEFPGIGRFPVQDFPHIGLPGPGQAPALLVFDWTCAHCRELQGSLASRKEHAAAFLLIPGHTSDEGKEIHRQLLTAFYADPAGYAEVSTALLSGTMPASPQAVGAALEKRLGTRRWQKSLAGTASRVNGLLSLGDSLMNRTASTVRASSLPQILSPRGVLTGTPDEAGLSAFLKDLPSQAAQAAELAEQAERAAREKSLNPAGAAPAVTEGAVIRFSSQTVTCPPVAQGEVAALEIRFENPGTAPLKILSCNGGCGCVSPSGVEQTVPPGGSGSFRVDYKTAGQRVGTSTRTLRIYSDAGNVPAGQCSFVNIVVPVTPPRGPAVPSGAATGTQPTASR